MKRSSSILVVLVLLMLIVAACSSPHKTVHARERPSARNGDPPTVPAPIHTELEEVRSLTALGDSVPYGTSCECTPYPQLSGADIARIANHDVDVANDAVPGATTATVVDQLSHDENVITDVERSHAILLEIGANDVSYTTSCGTTLACYEPAVPAIASNVQAIIDRIHALRQGQPIEVIVLDYWSVWLGGKYATGKGPAYEDAADAITLQVNNAIRTTAQSTKSIYVDVRTAFRGPNGEWDETHLLAPDGDHPNAAGHRRIAQAIAHTLSVD